MCVSVLPSCAEYVLLQFIFLAPELGKYNLVLIIKSPGHTPELKERKLLAYLGCPHKYKQPRETADLCITLRGDVPPRAASSGQGRKAERDDNFSA